MFDYIHISYNAIGQQWLATCTDGKRIEVKVFDTKEKAKKFKEKHERS